MKSQAKKPIKNSSFNEKGEKHDNSEIVYAKEKLNIGGMAFEVKRKTKKGGKDTKKKDEKLTSGGTLLKSGRHLCYCEGRLHQVLTNCINCGKIICEQEKYGDCLFCQTPVNPKEDFSKKEKSNPSFMKAVEHRNKLIEFDKSYTQRTVVYDEQTDYYESDVNKWLSEQEKKERKEKEDKLKQLMKDKTKSTYTIDFLGKKVYEEKSKTQDEIQKVLSELRISKTVTERVAPNPTVPEKLTFKEYKKKNSNTSSKDDGNTTGFSRVQDSYFEDQENIPETPEFEQDLSSVDPSIIYENPSSNESDVGKCLSMHQPWASLLVQGIKRHEGRFWESEYRGRLWIASTAQEPSQEEIQEMEEYYKKLGRTYFPKYYPTSALLGCVDLVDVVKKDDYEEYTKKNKMEAESESEYVFICKNPRKLLLPFSIAGKPYIWNLDPETKKSAMQGLKKIELNKK